MDERSSPPPSAVENSGNRPLLILDLDETLIHASMFEKTADKIAMYSDRYVVYYIYKRPYVDKFLDFCCKSFDVAVWTAASEEYAKRMVSLVFLDRPLKFLYTKKNCIHVRNDDSVFSEFDISCVAIKDLKKVWKRKFDGNFYSKHKTLIVDDTPSTFQRNYGNAIHIRPWDGDSQDRELHDLKRYLKVMLSIDGSWRRVNKMNWREDADV